MRENPGKKSERGFDALQPLKEKLAQQQQQMQQSAPNDSAQSHVPPPVEEERPPVKSAAQGLAEEFHIEASKDGADAAEVYKKIQEKLGDIDEQEVLAEMKKLGWNIEEKMASEDDMELSSLQTVKAVREKLGEPAGAIDGISYWILSNGDAAMLSGGAPEDRRLQRWGQGGYQKIKGIYYEYKDGSFKKISEDEVSHRRSAMMEAQRSNQKVEKKNSLDDAKKAPDNKKTDKASRQSKTDTSEKRDRIEMKEVNFDALHRTFHREVRHNHKTVPQAFEMTVQGLQIEIVRQFKDQLVADGEKSALLEGSLRHIEDLIRRGMWEVRGSKKRHEKKEKPERSESEKERFERELAADLAKIAAKT